MMTWTTRLALSFLVVICSQSLFALCQSPWESASIAESFMTYFSDALERSGAFTNEQLDDIETIATSIKLGVDKMERNGKTSGSKLQAMNTAFASAVAEIAMTEGGGQTTEIKTKAIADALAFAFIQTKGAVNISFINEIRNLISMFAQRNTISSSSDSVSASAGRTSGINGYGQGEAKAAGIAAAGSGVAGQGDYGQEETGARYTAAIATAAADAAGADGAGRIGYGQSGAGTGDAVAAATTAAAAQGGQNGQDSASAGAGKVGRADYGQGGAVIRDSPTAIAATVAGATAAASTAERVGYYQVGAGVGDAASSAGVIGANRVYDEGLAVEGDAAAASTAAIGEQGGYGGQGRSGFDGGLRGAATSAAAAAARLSSPNSASRVSNSVSYLLTNGGPSSSVALSNTINNAVSEISASNPGLSTCDILVQALLELISALIHILRSATIGQVDPSSAGQSTSMVEQSVYRAFF